MDGRTASNTTTDKLWLSNAFRKKPKATKKNSKERSDCINTGSLSSVRQLVRSFSDRYNIASPRVSCKQQSSCSTENHEFAIPSSSAAATTSTTTNSSSSASSLFYPVSGPRSSSSSDTFVFTSSATKPFPDEPQEKKLDDSDEAGEFWSLYFRATPSPSSSSSLWSSHSLLPPNSTKPTHLFQATAKATPFAAEGLTSAASQPHTAEQLVSKDSVCSADIWQKLEALAIDDSKAECMAKLLMVLRDLCVKQDEEIRMLKASVNVTMKEVAQLHMTCRSQDRELAQSRSAIPALQAQVSSLAQQLRAIAQVKSCERSQPDVSVKDTNASNINSCDPIDITDAQLTKDQPQPATIAQLTKDQTQSATIASATREEEKTLPAEVKSALHFKTGNVSEEIPIPSRNPLGEGRHRRGFSAVLPTEKLLKQSEKRASKRQATAEKETRSALGELNGVGGKRQQEQQEAGMAMAVQQQQQQEGCENAHREWRSSSSRFTSLEPLKSIFTCTSPQLLRREEAQEENVKVESMSNTVWNLKPT